MFLSQGGSVSDRGVNDDPVYAKVAPPNVEKLNFATSDSPTHDAFSSCGPSDVVGFQKPFHFGCICLLLKLNQAFFLWLFLKIKD